MKLCRLVILAAILLYSPLSLSDVSSEKEAEKLLNRIGVGNVLEQSISKMLDFQIKRKPELAPYRDVMERFLRKYMSYKSLKSELIKIYSEAFTASELAEINAFYATDVGKKSIRLMPVLMMKGAELGERRVKEHRHEFKEMIKARSESLRRPGADTDPCSHIDSKQNLREKAQCLDKQIASIRNELNHKRALHGLKKLAVITDRTKDPVLAKYYRTWKHQVETFGNIQHLFEAGRNKMYGIVVLSAHIKADGSLVKAEVRRSSGNPEVEKMTIDAVKIAAPFDAFPEQMRNEYDDAGIIATFRYGEKNNNFN